MAILQLLGPDQTTVLWDFDDSTGAANPSTVITQLGGSPDFGTIEPQIRTWATAGQNGARLLGASHPPVEMSIPFTASATTDTNLWTGLGQLGRYLAGVSPEQPLFLKWSELSTDRYIDVIGALNLPQLLRGQSSGAIVATRKNSLGPIPLRLLRQPWMRGPEVTVTGVTVPNDPATSTKARVYPVTGVTGDLPTPAKVKIQNTTGAMVSALVAWRSRGTRAATYFSDYLSETGFAQLEATGRGWTIALGTDTAGATDANASPGSGTSVARCTYATDATSVQRVSATRTTKLDSLRGSWDVWLRCKGSAVSVHEIQLFWLMATTTTAALSSSGAVIHDLSAAASFGYVELNVGRIQIPEDPALTLGTLHFRLFAARTSGTGNLDMDLLWLVPAGEQGKLHVDKVSGGWLATNDSLQTDPATYAVNELASTGEFRGASDLEGAMPASLHPGDNHIMVRPSRLKLVGHTEEQNTLADVTTVSVIYSPRYAL